MSTSISVGIGNLPFSLFSCSLIVFVLWSLIELYFLIFLLLVLFAHYLLQCNIVYMCYSLPKFNHITLCKCFPYYNIIHCCFQLSSYSTNSWAKGGHGLDAHAHFTGATSLAESAGDMVNALCYQKSTRNRGGNVTYQYYICDLNFSVAQFKNIR